MSVWSWLKRLFVETFEPALSGAWDGGAGTAQRKSVLPDPRPRGWIATTPEEIEAVWVEARVTVRAERRARLRRVMGRQP